MRFFAIIPAAGRSVRMGRPKLLLPWRGSTIIEHALAAWQASCVNVSVLVAHPDDGRLADVARACGAVVVQPRTPPPDMKASVRIGLAHVAREQVPRDPDAWLLAPADMPRLSSTLIDRVIEAYQASIDAGEKPAIWVPAFGGRRGHPVLFPWSLAVEVERLGADEGVNALLDRFAVRTVDAEPLDGPDDLDTPEDYQRLRERRGD